MDARNIGSLEVSVVGLGCNNFGGRIDAEATDRVVHAAFLPYFPLSSGVLTGKHRADREPDPQWRLASIPEDRRRTFLDDDLAEVDRITGRA